MILAESATASTSTIEPTQPGPRRYPDSGQASDQPDGQGREIIGDLDLRQFRGPEPDDRQNAEQAQAQARAHRRGGQSRRHRQHADVHSHQRHRQVLAAMTRHIQGER